MKPIRTKPRRPFIGRSKRAREAGQRIKAKRGLSPEKLAELEKQREIMGLKQRKILMEQLGIAEPTKVVSPVLSTTQTPIISPQAFAFSLGLIQRPSQAQRLAQAQAVATGSGLATAQVPLLATASEQAALQAIAPAQVAKPALTTALSEKTDLLQAQKVAQDIMKDQAKIQDTALAITVPPPTTTDITTPTITTTTPQTGVPPAPPPTTPTPPPITTTTPPPRTPPPRTPPPRVPKPPPPPPKVPPPPILIPGKDETRRSFIGTLGTRQGYDVMVKRKLAKLRKGKFKSRGYVKANKQALTRLAALGMGAGLVDTYTNRSYTIRKSKKQPVSRPDLEARWRALAVKFRASKARKNVLVERALFAIDSIQEKQGIPYEAARLRRQRQTGFIGGSPRQQSQQASFLGGGKPGRFI